MRQHTELLRARLLGWLYRHDWQLAAVLAVAAIAVAVYVLWPRTVPAAARTPVISADEVDAAQERTVIVYLSGAVRNPGLYTLASTLRVSDAIVAAGGLTEAADPNCLPNLAAHLKDAKQIAVPFSGHCGGKGKQAKLDINTATREQLLPVPGMDAGLADAIIKYREDFGGFVALTELKSAMGLDTATYRQLAKTLTVN
jgi:competence ComEA-like helix-hairpin-helix protein